MPVLSFSKQVKACSKSVKDTNFSEGKYPSEVVNKTVYINLLKRTQSMGLTIETSAWCHWGRSDVFILDFQYIQYHNKSFHAVDFFLYPLKPSENFWFLNPSRRYRKTAIPWNLLSEYLSVEKFEQAIRAFEYTLAFWNRVGSGKNNTLLWYPFFKFRTSHCMSLQINVCLHQIKNQLTSFNNMICRYDRNLSQKRFKVRDLVQILLLKLSEFKQIN